MSQPIRIIAVDLDGTLLNSKKQISAEDHAALKEAVARGIEVVPTTGRNYSFALPAIQALPFETMLVCSNGAIIRSSRGDTRYQRLLARQTGQAILAASREFHSWAVLMYDQGGPGQLRMLNAPALPEDGVPPDAVIPAVSNGNGMRSIADSAWAKRNHALIQTVECLEQSLSAETFHADPLEILYAGPLAEMRRLAAHLQDRFSGSVFTDGPGPLDLPEDLLASSFSLMRTEYPAQNFSMLDVIHAQCSKGRALEQLARQRGIPREQVMAIGDNWNDLEMLEFAGLPMVMGNSTSEFKTDTVTRRGWTLTQDCDSSGVACALRRYVL